MAQHRSLTGTARYASINAHKGCEQSRRDDLESIGHVLLYFLRGRLPWQSLPAPNKVEKYRKIMQTKIDTHVLDVLCKDPKSPGYPKNGTPFPKEFAHYLSFARNLEFKQDPDYNTHIKAFRNRFKQGFNSERFELDFMYDWRVKMKDRGFQATIRGDAPATLKMLQENEETEQARRAEAGEQDSDDEDQMLAGMDMDLFRQISEHEAPAKPLPEDGGSDAVNHNLGGGKKGFSDCCIVM